MPSLSKHSSGTVTYYLLSALAQGDLEQGGQLSLKLGEGKSEFDIKVQGNILNNLIWLSLVVLVIPSFYRL